MPTSTRWRFARSATARQPLRPAIRPSQTAHRSLSAAAMISPHAVDDVRPRQRSRCASDAVRPLDRRAMGRSPALIRDRPLRIADRRTALDGREARRMHRRSSGRGCGRSPTRPSRGTTLGDRSEREAGPASRATMPEHVRRTPVRRAWISRRRRRLSVRRHDRDRRRRRYRCHAARRARRQPRSRLSRTILPAHDADPREGRGRAVGRAEDAPAVHRRRVGRLGLRARRSRARTRPTGATSSGGSRRARPRTSRWPSRPPRWPCRAGRRRRRRSAARSCTASAS